MACPRARRVARDGFDHVTLHLVLAGSTMLEVPGAVRRVGAGSVALFDLTRPQHTWTEGARIVTVSIARDRLDAATLDGLDLHGLVLEPREAGLVIDFARSLAAHAAALTLELAGAATDSLCLMLGATLASLRDKGGRSRRIARGPGRSPERAVRLRRALSRADEHRTVDELAGAAGFTSPSHAGRVFRDVFGVRPREYRRNLRAASSPGIAPVGLAAWHGALL